MAREATQLSTGAEFARKRHSEFSIILASYRRHKLAVAGSIVLIILILSAIFAPVISPHDPYEVNMTVTRNGYPREPSLSYPWGTDNLGRDYLSRAMFGGRISLSVGFVAVGIAISVGTLVGVLSGYFGGVVDQVLMRLTDLALSFPPLIILLALASVLQRPSVFLIMVIIGGLLWMTTARLVRAEFLALQQQDFVVAARAIGCSNARIAVLHMLRNALSPIIVAASLGIPQAILNEATLSFLGVGVQVPTPSWGNMLTLSLRFMKEGAWWIGVYPGVLIALAVLSFNFIGDGMRDAFDPRLRDRRQ